MSGSFQVLMVIERLLETSEPSPVDAVNGLAGRKQTKDWRVVGSLFTQGMLVVGFWNHRSFKSARVWGFWCFCCL